MIYVNKLTIKELHELFEKRKISPTELLQETMQRAKDAEPKINAYREFTLEYAKKSARVADIKVFTGQITSPILGIPFSVKDNIDVEGTQSCFGSLSTPVEPKVSAPVVKSLMASGGCLIGKTNMTEFGAKASSDSPLSGITSNPRNLNYTTGGSSAGAAASVAAGVTSFAIATDGGGSARIPASFCGLVGFKPTFGLVSVYPPPIVGDLFHISIIARNIADILEVLKVVTGQNDLFNKRKAEARISFKSLCTNKKNKKIRFFWSFSNQVPDADVKNVIEKALEICSAAGVDIVEPKLALTTSLYEIFESKFLGGIIKKVSNVPNFRQFGDKEIIKEIDKYQDKSSCSDDYINSEIEKLENFLCHALQNADLIMCPTVLHTPFLKSSTRPPGTEALGILEWPSNCIFANLIGLPAVTIPCGTTSDGLPIGVQLISSRYKDIELLNDANMIHEMLGAPYCNPTIVV